MAFCQFEFLLAIGANLTKKYGPWFVGTEIGYRLLLTKMVLIQTEIQLICLTLIIKNVYFNQTTESEAESRTKNFLQQINFWLTYFNFPIFWVYLFSNYKLN